MKEPYKNDKNAFHFILKVLFVLKIFKCLFCFFGYVEKTTCLWCHNLIKKQLQYTYCLNLTE